MHREMMQKWGKDNFPLSIVATEMNDTVPEHTHDFMELVIFQRGSATHALHLPGGKVSYAVMQGDCFSVLPGETHSFSDGNHAFYYNIIFSPELIRGQTPALEEFDSWESLFGSRTPRDRKKIHLPLADRMQIDAYLARLKEELDRRTRGYKTVAVSILLEILVLLLRCSPKQMAVKSGTLPGDGGSLLKVVNALEKAPEKHLSLAQMAKLSGMCVSSFTRKFRILTGVSPTEYLISLRIEKAENLLKTTDLPVYAIADACGFNNINYFIKTFRRFRHVTPAKFRAGRN
ncbi:MAG: helix-turn-helix domain-containing protein [Lentisphaeria bacterium]|nr:helix-turn-helix domain-containing protein [Lentisphaeria bacterium]